MENGISDKTRVPIAWLFAAVLSVSAGISVFYAKLYDIDSRLTRIEQRVDDFLKAHGKD